MVIVAQQGLDRPPPIVHACHDCASRPHDHGVRAVRPSARPTATAPTSEQHMCLGIPGQVVELLTSTDHLATVEVTGVRRTINIGLVEDDGLELGDWVLIHVGFAMSIIDEEEAARAMEDLQLLGEQFETEVSDIAGSRIE
jgi:hydrogenase expression/formation protein HypC